jgi:hypothetical protein
MLMEEAGQMKRTSLSPALIWEYLTKPDLGAGFLDTILQTNECWVVA